MKKSKLLKIVFGGVSVAAIAVSASGNLFANPMSFQTAQVQCVTGFSKKSHVKGRNGETMKMVCESPIITCPKNAQPGITTSLEPAIKNLGSADGQQRFRFVYSCQYFKVEG